MRFLPFSLVAFTTVATLSALLLTATSHTAFAQVSGSRLIGNTDVSFTSGPNSAITSSGGQKALAFTTGGTPYSVAYLEALLSSASPAATSTLSFALYTASDTNSSDPNIMVCDFGKALVYTGIYDTFLIPTTPFILAANTRYVLLCDYVSGGDGLWLGSYLPQNAPTARNNSGFFNPVYRVSTNNGASYSTDTSTYNLFTLFGNPVVAAAPEPGSLYLLGMGLVTGAGSTGMVRQRKAKRTAK